MGVRLIVKTDKLTQEVAYPRGVASWNGGKMAISAEGNFDGAKVMVVVNLNPPKGGKFSNYRDPEMHPDGEWITVARITSGIKGSMKHRNPMAVALRAEGITPKTDVAITLTKE